MFSMDKHLPEKKELMDDSLRFFTIIMKKDIAAYASSTAFFFFIAIIPFLILLSMLLPLTGITDEQLIRVVTTVTPEFTDLMVVLIIKQAYSASTGVASISILALLYATARGMVALLRGLNDIYEIRKRNDLSLIVRSVLYTLLMIVNMTLLLVLIVFGEAIMHIMLDYLVVPYKLTVIFTLRYLFILAVGVLSLMFIYAFIPAKRQPFKKQFPGAIFTTLAWVIFSYIFSLFISSSIYSTYYGSLASVAVFMLWLYGVFYILLLGAVINQSLKQH